MHTILRRTHHIRANTDTTTRIVAFGPRHIALYHLKRFAKICVVTAATIIALLYTAVLVVGVPTINL